MNRRDINWKQFLAVWLFMVFVLAIICMLLSQCSMFEDKLKNGGSASPTPYKVFIIENEPLLARAYGEEPTPAGLSNDAFVSHVGKIIMVLKYRKGWKILGLDYVWKNHWSKVTGEFIHSAIIYYEN